MIATPPTPIRAFVRRPAFLAAVVGAVVVTVCLLQGSTPFEAALAVVLLCVPLTWRIRWPVGVLGVVLGGLVITLVLVPPTPGFVAPVMVALYTVAAYGSRRQTVLVAVGLLPCAAVLSATVVFEDGGATIPQFFNLVSQIGVALAVGEAVRSHRSLLGAMRERAERAERDREQEALRRVGEERMRIARDVHDVVAHSIATITTQASVGAHIGREEPDRAIEMLESIKDVSADALHDLRHALGFLREPESERSTDPTPSLQRLPELVRQARSSGLPVVLQMEGSPAGLPVALQIATYRIVQEGLTNVMRHAGGAKATVRVAVASHRVEVDIADDGTGGPTAGSEAGTGSGLAGMRDRTNALGGTFAAGPATGGGFRVHAVLPVEELTA